MGLPPENIIKWPKNGIEYYYPPTLLDRGLETTRHQALGIGAELRSIAIERAGGEIALLGGGDARQRSDVVGHDFGGDVMSNGMPIIPKSETQPRILSPTAPSWCNVSCARTDSHTKIPMLIEDVAEVELRNIELLHKHFEKILMPDEEYIQLSEVLISAGASIAKESGYLSAEVEGFEAALRQQAKDYWLSTCAKNISSQEDSGRVLAESQREYENIVKQQLKPRRKRARV